MGIVNDHFFPQISIVWGFGKFPTESLPFSPGTFVHQVVLLSHLWISAFWSDGWGPTQWVDDVLRLGDTTKTTGGEKGEVCFVKVCKITTLGKMLGLIWFIFFWRWLLWNKVRSMFRRFRCETQKKVTWLLTSIAQCTPFGMHHFRFKIDLGYTWLHPPKPSMSPRKGTWNTVHLPTIDFHFFQQTCSFSEE